MLQRGCHVVCKTHKSLADLFMKRIAIFSIALACFGAVACSKSTSQSTVAGNFPNLAGQQISLFGFEGFNTYAIDGVMADDQGRFALSFGEKDYGMG